MNLYDHYRLIESTLFEYRNRANLLRKVEEFKQSFMFPKRDGTNEHWITCYVLQTFAEFKDRDASHEYYFNEKNFDIESFTKFRIIHFKRLSENIKVVLNENTIRLVNQLNDLKNCQYQCKEEFSECVEFIEGIKFELTNIPIHRVKYDFDKLIYDIKMKAKDFGSNQTTEKPVFSKELTLIERFDILRLMNVVNQIEKMNCSQMMKYQILSNLLVCDITNARKLMTGTYKNSKTEPTELYNSIKDLLH
jgi:hypothetical protein